MPAIEGSIDIAAPRQAVWDLMCDVPRYPEFGNLSDETHMISEGEFGEGSVYSESGKVAGMKYESEWTVTRFEPISKQVHFGVESSMHLELTWTLTEIDAENTRATQVVDVTMMPSFRPLGVLIEKLFVIRKMTGELATLREDIKRIAEAESGTN
ncbi:MAG: hypothetical protein BMS9Abin17_0210 [Acidimicrobiia bacterium]|nr:MAG: hypothetical protein BMS9Abin17_0210 [Acidimicrobiia bacterium]